MSFIPLQRLLIVGKENLAIRTLIIGTLSFVQTDMGNTGARKVGLEKAFIEVDDCVRGLVLRIDEATREKTSGTFPSWDGGEFSW